MNSEEFMIVVKDYLESGVALNTESWVIAFLLVVIGSFLGAYFKEKGKNVATKSDVESITRKIESIKVESAQKFEALSQANRELLAAEQRRHDLRLAALDKRLEAHQEAYAIWYEYSGAIHDEDRLFELYKKAMEFWKTKSLYLTEAAREAFDEAINAGSMHRSLLQSRAEKKEIDANWMSIRSAGGKIAKAVSLPDLGDSEYQKEKS